MVFVQSVLWSIIDNLFSILPLSSLLYFIMVPAPVRPVFAAAAGPVSSVVYSTFIRLILPWIVRTDCAQAMMADMVATAQLYHDNPHFDPSNRGGVVHQGIQDLGDHRLDKYRRVGDEL
jgi:hypothetical protein